MSDLQEDLRRYYYRDNRLFPRSSPAAVVATQGATDRTYVIWGMTGPVFVSETTAMQTVNAGFGFVTAIH